MPYIGISGSWQTIATTSTNGFLQTTGTGLAVNPSPIITGTANIPSPCARPIGDLRHRPVAYLDGVELGPLTGLTNHNQENQYLP